MESVVEIPWVSGITEVPAQSSGVGPAALGHQGFTNRRSAILGLPSGKHTKSELEHCHL